LVIIISCYFVVWVETDINGLKEVYPLVVKPLFFCNFLSNE
jgi:hypothetical protein